MASVGSISAMGRSFQRRLTQMAFSDERADRSARRLCPPPERRLRHGQKRGALQLLPAPCVRTIPSTASRTLPRCPRTPSDSKGIDVSIGCPPSRCLPRPETHHPAAPSTTRGRQSAPLQPEIDLRRRRQDDGHGFRIKRREHGTGLRRQEREQLVLPSTSALFGPRVPRHGVRMPANANECAPKREMPQLGDAQQLSRQGGLGEMV